MCKNLIKVLELHRSNLHPAVLSTSKDSAELGLTQTSENLWLPVKGKGQIEQICNNESKRVRVHTYTS